ncbi:hypothetical protein BJ741DRAFT_704801 [Chytriomyces cf. hyalinus JEL632]|nr:hypothetical protein BJ741DRAFT_704801 [Chytriomyces cf. hyalinus JEL632]
MLQLGTLAQDDVCRNDSDCSSAGSCVQGKCVCDQLHSGVFCERRQSQTRKFSPREFHSAVYDSTRDLMIITAGRSVSTYSNMLNDMLIYNFSNSSWSSVTPSPRTVSPAQRFGHTTFMMNGLLYLYGGATTAPDGNSIWNYNIDTRLWRQQQTSGSNPPMLEGAAYVFTQDSLSAKLYVYGGFVPARNSRLSRRLFVLDLLTLTWKQLANSPYPAFGHTGVYHKSTNSLYFAGGYKIDETPGSKQPILQYQIDANVWYIGPLQDLATVKTYGSAFLVPNSDTLMLWGGYSISAETVTDARNPCFSQQFQVYDLACQTWNYIDVPDSQFLRRKGHSTIVRNNSIFIYGGMNGYLLNDVVELAIPATSLPSKDRDYCRSQYWCSGSYYWCQDCTARSFCSWCENTCVYNVSSSLIPTINATVVSGETSLSMCSADQSIWLSSFSSTCPVVNEVYVNQTVTRVVLSEGKYIDFKSEIDLPTYDVKFIAKVISPSNASISINILSIRASGMYSNMSNAPFVSMNANDSLRYSGPYVVRISNPIPLHQKYAISFNFTVIATSAVSNRLDVDSTNNSGGGGTFGTGGGGGGGDGGGGSGGGGGGGGSGPPSILTSFDTDGFLTTFGLCLLAVSIIVYMVQRSRELSRIRRQLALNADRPLPRTPPPFYKVTMSIPDATLKQLQKIGFERRPSGVSDVSCGSTHSATPLGKGGFIAKRWGGRTERILSSARLNPEELARANVPVPLSIEPVIHLPPNGEGAKAVSINRIILNPGAAALIARGHVPAVCIGSTLREFVPSTQHATSPVKSTWLKPRKKL